MLAGTCVAYPSARLTRSSAVTPWQARDDAHDAAVLVVEDVVVDTRDHRLQAQGRRHTFDP